MLLESDIHIGVYCGACCKYESHEISLFKLHKDEEVQINSIRSDEYITIKTYDYKNFYLSVYCPSCNTRHIYKYTLSQIIKNKLKVFKCELTKLDIIFVGDKNDIDESIEKLNNEINDIMTKCGFEEHIKNPHIMMKVLDRIHEIAEKGNLFCDCGCQEVDVNLFYDRIELKCMMCNSLNIIYTETHQDFKNIANRELIVLHESSFTCLDSIYF